MADRKAPERGNRSFNDCAQTSATPFWWAHGAVAGRLSPPGRRGQAQTKRRGAIGDAIFTFARAGTVGSSACIEIEVVGQQGRYLRPGGPGG
jgi:hypothetical protein